MISFSSLRLPMARLVEGGLPLLNNPQPVPGDEIFDLLGEEAGRRLVRPKESLLPYLSQSRYGRAVSPTDTPVAVLENDRLRATFLLDLGGRLWSLFDKDRGRELLFQPDAIQFGNLALRDAWFAGGIEWNLGITGHWGLTCEPICAGTVGNVLRMWAYERLTGLVWRVEATLDADRLLIGVRLRNPHSEAVGLYWWSNTAVPMERSRVLVDATSALCNGYDQKLSRVPWPVAAPERQQHAADYFFEIGSPWQAAVDDDGYGLLQTSTPELHGRKLFVWGDGAGGQRWQGWLNGRGRYVEVQAGYARTQHEHIALEPGSEVSWVESYGPVQLAAGELPQACSLPDPFSAVRDQEPDVWRANDGWGRVEIEAGHLPADPATPFGSAEAAGPAAWISFLSTGVVPETVETVVGPGWERRIADADESPWQQLHLGYGYWAAGRSDSAVGAWRRSIALRPTAPAHWALSQTSVDGWDRFDHAEQAFLLDPGCEELLVGYLRLGRHLPGLVLRVIDGLPDRQRQLPRVRLEFAYALIAAQRLEEADAVVSGLELPDIREGSDDLTAVWQALQEAMGCTAPLPTSLDFRMH